MRALIAVNGVIEDYTAIARRLHADDLLIGADGGAAHWLAMGRRPQLVVGDLDSLPAAMVDGFIAQGVQVERHPREKDQTDLELAIERALAHGASEVLLIGALGGRLDQTLANLLILAQRAWATPVRIMEGDQLAEILRGPGALDLHGPRGGTVSLIPLSETVRGITYTGLRYPLDDATLPFGSTRGVSNEFLTSPATITIQAGMALVIHTVADAAP